MTKLIAALILAGTTASAQEVFTPPSQPYANEIDRVMRDEITCAEFTQAIAADNDPASEATVLAVMAFAIGYDAATGAEGNAAMVKISLECIFDPSATIGEVLAG